MPGMVVASDGGRPRRVVAVGLDAAERRLVDDLINEGDLPNLARIRASSATCRLNSDPAYRHGHVWPQFLSGSRSGSRQELLDGSGFDPATYRAWGLAADAPPFFVADPNPETIAFDVPHLSLQEGFRGAMVTSWGGHGTQYPRAAQPAGLLREIDAKFGPHPACNNEYSCQWHRVEAIDRLTEALVAGARRRADISLWLQRRFPEWRLFITVMSEAHSIGETCWHGVDPTHPLHDLSAGATAAARTAVLAVYRALDDAVGRIVAGAPEGTVVVVFTLHGMRTGPGDVASGVLLPELLHRHHRGRNFLRAPDADVWRARGWPRLAPALSETWDTHMARWRIRKPAATRARLAVQAILPAGAVLRLRGLWSRQGHGDGRGGSYGFEGLFIPAETMASPAEIGARRESLSWSPTTWYSTHWPTMPSFALPSSSDGYVRINLSGRERAGLVPPAGYGAACGEVEDLLGACQDPRTGRGVLEGIQRPAADPFAQAVYADLIVRWAGSPDALEHPRLGTVGPYPLRRMGTHGPEGFAFVTGPGVETADLGEHSILDLAPTLMRLLGLEPGDHLEGRPLPIGGAAMSC